MANLIPVCTMGLAFLHIAHSFPTGAPTLACELMTPNHGEAVQTSDPPYNVTLSHTSYTTGDTVTVSIDTSDGEPFKGFLLQARPSNGSADSLGTFTVGANMANVDCFSKTQNAATHDSRDEKSNVSVTWQPGVNDTDDVIFTATLVRNKTLIWINVVSVTLPFTTIESTTEPPTTTQAVVTTQAATTPEEVTTTTPTTTMDTVTDSPTTASPATVNNAAATETTTTPASTDTTTTTGSPQTTVTTTPAATTESTTTVSSTQSPATTTTASSQVQTDGVTATDVTGGITVSSNDTMTVSSNSTADGNSTTTVSTMTTDSATTEGSGASRDTAAYGVYALLVMVLSAYCVGNINAQI